MYTPGRPMLEGQVLALFNITNANIVISRLMLRRRGGRATSEGANERVGQRDSDEVQEYRE